jgi:L-malate glycosyltransferase
LWIIWLIERMSKVLKILLISPLPPPVGGIATWTENFVNWVKHSNHEARVVNTAVVGKRMKQLSLRPSLNDEIRRTYKIIKDLKEELKINPPNIVHLNSSCGKLGIIRDYFCGYIIKRKKIPLIVHYRCNIKDQLRNNKIGKFFFKRLTEISSRILVLNEASEEYVELNTNRKSIIVSNFISEENVIKVPKEISKTINSVIFVGHTHYAKGIREIIEVAKSLPEIIFTLAGPISHEIKILKIPNNIQLTGSLKPMEIRKLMDCADVFLFPSYSEGFSNALLEAMSRGLPVITTNVGANSNMIEDSGGLIVDVESIKSILDALNKMESNSIRENMSKWNINKVNSTYIIDRVIKDLIEIYGEVIKNETQNS